MLWLLNVLNTTESYCYLIGKVLYSKNLSFLTTINEGGFMQSVVFEGTLASGVDYKVAEASSFTGRDELAIIVGGVPVAIVSVVDKPRAPYVEVKVQPSKAVKIQKLPVTSQKEEPSESVEGYKQTSPFDGSKNVEPSVDDIA